MFPIIYLFLGYGKEQANSQQYRIDHLVILSLKNHYINALHYFLTHIVLSDLSQQDDGLLEVQEL